VHPGSSLKSATAKVLIALFVLSCVSRAHTRRPHTHKTHSQAIDAQLCSTTAYVLDTDSKAARVTLQSNGFDKTISIKFGNSKNKVLGFTTRSDDSGNLVAGDIDRDGDVDLIWVGGADRNNAIVLINQGEGNFAESGDNSLYASELDELFDPGDSPHKRSLKKHHKSSSLTSSSFSDIALDLELRFHAPAVKQHPGATVERVADRLAILTHLRKRGPPSILS